LQKVARNIFAIVNEKSIAFYRAVPIDNHARKVRV